MITVNKGERRREVIEEVEWLLRMGTDRPDRIADRLGYSSFQTLMSSLQRWGRRDLAARFKREEWDPLFKRQQKQW